MKSQTVHSNYRAKIVLEIRSWENGIELPRGLDDKNGTVRKTFSYRGRNISLELLKINNIPSWLLIFDMALDEKWLLQDYLWDLYRKGLGLPSGGLVFLDDETGELISTNWDIGETEEWSNILEKLEANKDATHTFSATDDAIELKVLDDAVSLQNLNWEAMPDRLATSRETSPIHLFKSQTKFASEINNCLVRLNSILDNAKKMDNDMRNFIFGYFSAEYRRQNRRQV